MRYVSNLRHERLELRQAYLIVFEGSPDFIDFGAMDANGFVEKLTGNSEVLRPIMDI